MADGKKLLKATDLSISVRKGGVTLKAVDNISFTIGEGEIIGLAGESGCGKTLTALSIPSLLPQAAAITGGWIRFDSKLLTSLQEKELAKIRGKEISVIFQETRQALNPLLKVGGQITEILELGGRNDKTENRRVALDILHKLGFEEPEAIFASYPHQLSGGMCQRVMAAIAAVCRPRLLLADEPSTALDTASQELILSLLMEMNRDQGTAILIISHNLSIIRRFCSRFLVMYAGKIIEEGPARNFTPLHPYTKALLGAIPGRDKRGAGLETIPGKVPSIEDIFPGCPFAPRCRKAREICKQFFPQEEEIGGRRVYCHFPETGGGDG
ncbi:MAG: ABC transporter ATP-binding protein [Treponema sp.]|nr:ABC transporter ATP-binding protein [Treponema sp.]